MLTVVLSMLEIISSLAFSFVHLVAWKIHLYLLDGWFLLVFLTILHQLEKKDNNNNNNNNIHIYIYIYYAIKPIN